MAGPLAACPRATSAMDDPGVVSVEVIKPTAPTTDLASLAVIVAVSTMGDRESVQAHADGMRPAHGGTAREIEDQGRKRRRARKPGGRVTISTEGGGGKGSSGWEPARSAWADMNGRSKGWELPSSCQ